MAASSRDQEESDIYRSEETTPDSDHLLENIIRQTTPQTSTSVPRVRRGPIVRRRRPQSNREGETPRGVHKFTIEALQNLGATHFAELSTSPTFTFVTPTPSSASTERWNTPGFVIEEEEGAFEVDMDDGREGEGDEEEGRDVSEDFDLLLEPKIESPDHDLLMGDLHEAESSMMKSGEDKSPSQMKRPRGRPRKHPVPTIESLAKVAKGRSKTGCITCRKRKKKCDEAKPRCMNCEKNAVLCEGYPERTIWKSGKEKADEALMRRWSLPTIHLPPVIHGVDTLGDRIFFQHYVHRLSAVLTVEGPTKNAFKDMLLPMAVKHLGLMHSILALSSSNIDYQTPYGRAILDKNPQENEDSLQVRAAFHREEALKEFCADIERQNSGGVENAILSVRYGQMLCFVVQGLAEGRAGGEHRVHLQGYQKLIQESPPEEGPFMEFIKEYFQFHISLDELIGPPGTTAIAYDWSRPTNIIQPDAARLLGVQDNLFVCMSKITSIRNTIRLNMEIGADPVVDYTSLYRAAEIDAEIREWEPSWPERDNRGLASLLYKQMMWVYLWRTIYPPTVASWIPDTKIVQAVNDGLELLARVPPKDTSQTLLLAPTFIIGCAAFDVPQREPIRKSIATIREYTNLKNADRALEVLEEVWKLMDLRDERSWDWQLIAHSMDLDFLAT
jgi:hypothetical protein